jgi:hypothetical protein
MIIRAQGNQSKADQKEINMAQTTAIQKSSEAALVK